MNHRQRLVSLLPFFLLLTFLKSSYDKAGTSARYGPTFLPCYGYDASQLPSSNFFADAGNGVWDNSAACGRQYWVKCAGGTCVGQVIQVNIVGYVVNSVSQQSHEGSTMVLSHTAFRAIANSTADSVRIEFQRRGFINKEWIFSIFHKANWSFKLELKAEFENWTLEVKDIKVKQGNGTWCFHFKIEVGFLILKLKVMLEDF